MIISLDWLSDFVDLSGIAPEEIANRLTVHTAEVEGVETVSRAVENVVVGRVVACQPVSEGAATPVLAQVDIGGRRLSTVCGAPNVAVGVTVAVALPGARLSSGDVVQSATVYGHESTVVLCSAAELGWSTAHEGLILLPDEQVPGTPIDQLVPASDTLVEIDNKSLTHRPDLWGHFGFARELAAIFQRPLTPYPTVDLSQFDSLPPIDVQIESLDCPYYAALKVTAGANCPAPARMQSRLHAIGSRSRNLLVDVTNYVQFELGQPSHAFDGDKVQSIRVAASGRAQEMATLDGKRWQILPEDLLIHQGDKPIAIAGIMGGLDSEVSATTKTLLLESANFRAARIRHTSTRLALRTDASLRFEKKLPRVYARTAVGRVLQLFTNAGYDHQVVSRLSSAGEIHDQPRFISLPAGYVAQRAGADVSDAESQSLLESIGFRCSVGASGGLEVAVPAFRGEFDISIPEDISEEVMRLYGYNRITPQLPELPIRSTPPHQRTLNHHRCRRVLAEGHRFVEVQSYCWFDDAWLREIGYTPPRDALRIRNPLAVERGRMRESLLPNLLAFVLQNRRHSDCFRIFELGRLFWIDAAGEKQESNELAGVTANQQASSPEAEFRSVKGALEDLATAAGIGSFEFVRAQPGGPPWTATQATLSILHDSRPVGTIGVLPKGLRHKLLDSGHGVWFQLAIDELTGPLFPAVPYANFAVFPGSWQDFTFVWPTAQGYLDLRNLLNQFSHATVRELSFVTVYTPKGDSNSKYSFRFQLGWPDRTISADDLQSFRDAFLEFAAQNSLQIA
ncbi:MAG: phenylalanine--tRNA ligase subunit beta [Planctomycetaceae bacterium]